MGVSRPPDDGRARGDDSGLIDLDRLLQESKAAAPAAAAAPAPVAVALVVPAPVAVTSPVETAAASATPATPSARRRLAIRLVVVPPLLVLLVLVGVAFMGRFVGRSLPAPSPVNASALATAAATPPSTNAAPPPAPEPALPSAVDLPAIASSDRPVPARAPRAKDEPPAPATTATVSLVDVPAAPGAGSGDLGDAMKNAAGASDPKSAQVAVPVQPTGAATLRPATGALNATIANAVREARACLAADDAIVRATLTFEADGHSSARVGKVSSSQPGAEACVEHALGTAHVAPFVEAPLAVPVVVRPSG